jgi:hypothetical protein
MSEQLVDSTISLSQIGVIFTGVFNVVAFLIPYFTRKKKSEEERIIKVSVEELNLRSMDNKLTVALLIKDQENLKMRLDGVDKSMSEMRHNMYLIRAELQTISINLRVLIDRDDRKGIVNEK